MVDTIDLNRTFDLLTLVECDTSLRRIGAGWWEGPCPFCGGKNRFVLKETSEGWRWFCRNCGSDRYHTSIDYVMNRGPLDFGNAQALMGGGYSQASSRKGATLDRFTYKRESSIPTQEWQLRALAFVETCEAALRNKTGSRAMDYLHRRGLKPETIRQYRLGYNPAESFDPLEGWGLPEPDDGKRHAVWLPRGIVLPCFVGGTFWYVKFRRPLTQAQEQAGEQKYIKLKGCKPGIFGADNLRGAWLAVLTEGEFDCMLLDQEAGDLAGVATLGSATDRMSRLDLGTWGRYILQTAHFLAAYDLDREGEKGIRSLAGFSDRVHHAHLPHLPGIKDITDYWRAGGDLGDWIARTVEVMNLL